MVGKFCGKQVDKRPNGKTYVYHRDYYYYRCRKLSDSASCKHTKLIREDNLEEILLDKIDVYMTDYIAEAKVEDDTKTPTNTEDRITDIKGEMSRLTKAYRKNRITEEEYDRDYDKLEEKLHDLQSQLEPVKERNLNLYEELLKSDWRAVYDALNKENKRAFWRKYIKQIELTLDGNFDRVIFF